MSSKLLIFSLLFLFFGVRPAFAAISFSISNPQYNNGEVAIDVSISGLTTSSCLNGSCYLQAAFTSTSPIRYFGFTKNNNGRWYEYISSAGSDYIQSTFFTFTPTNGEWSGQMTVKINPDNPNYKGSGEYNLKAWRYSGKSDSYSGDSDNTLLLNIEGPATPSPTPTPTPTPTPKPSPTRTPTPAKTPSPTPAPKKSTLPTNTPSPTTSEPSPEITPLLSSSTNEISYQIASVAAAETSIPASSSATRVEIKSKKQINPLVWIGLIFVFAGVSSIGYIYLKQNAKIHIPLRK